MPLQTRSGPEADGGPSRLFQCGAAALLSIGFLWFVAPGLSAGFTPDDIMNLYGAWRPSWRELLLQAAAPFLPGLRPVGGILYRASFAAFGFDLTFVRAFLIGLIAVNLWLTAKLAVRVSGSVWAGWFAAVLFLYHVNLQGLYWNTGTCYDILAFTGTWGAALIALKARTEDVSWRWRVAAAVLFWLALGAKEAALALPAILLAFELLPGRRQILPLLAASALSLACVAGRIYGGAGILDTKDYHPVFTAESYANSLGAMLGGLFYRAQPVGTAETALFLAALAGVAAATGARSAWAVWLAFVLGALPVAFIPPRGVYAWYVPLAALCVLFATALSRLPAPKPALWLLTAVSMLAVHARAADRIPAFILEEQRVISRVIRALPRSDLRAAPGEMLVLAEDPFEGYRWGEWKAAMLIQLHTGVRGLVATSPAGIPTGRQPVRLGWRDGRFQRILQ